jgi:hypothetical protein
MKVLAGRITPDLEDHGTETSAAPTNGAELLRIVVLAVNQVCLVENLLRLFQADSVSSLDSPALRFVELEARIRI